MYSGQIQLINYLTVL